MKIAIIGYSGSGKSTLAQHLAKYYQIDMLHLDTVHHLPGWQVRERSESQKIVREFLDSHTDWVIDGTYSKLYFEERLENADHIIIFDFNRFHCLYRVIKRYFQYKDKTRPDMARGCNEKVDLAFTKWILYKGRTKAHRDRLKHIIIQYPDKVTVLKNQRQLTKFTNEFS